jgi:acyl-[acyl-carrier-protein]-phospholipid O-acyltransferase/long-chain-fatty-acid--[acyl-carrier-protein] ligase
MLHQPRSEPRFKAVAGRDPETLFAALLAARARFGGKRLAIEDADRQKLDYDRLVLGSLVLGNRLVAGTRPSEAIGVMLPNVAGLAVTLFGLNAFGRAAALINFTAGPRNIVSAVRTAVVTRVVTSRRFVEAAKLEPVVEALERAEAAPGRRVQIVYLEDVRARIGTFDKLQGAARALYAGTFHRRIGMTAGRTAVILFTSGTEGAPKGVVLSNANLVANCRQIITHSDGELTEADTLLNPLPMFHSFGLTAGTLMPLFNGMRIVLYPSPLHYKQVAKVVADSRATVLFATDTFLAGYARAADPGQLATLRFVVAGAERVKEATRKLWQGIGTDILEGYGATECAPVVACNLPKSNRHGTVGRALPDMELRLAPVEGITGGGRLMIRGPNVMAGYIEADHPGVVVPPVDGWHDTGDIVAIDDGFIVIKGRAKRFAKLGGEMVSLAAVETLAAGVWPDAQHVVVSLPDPRKGEQLILVTDRFDADKETLLDHARREGFPELWVPKAIMAVEHIPLLATGKVDIPATLAMVQKSRPLL